MREEISWRLWRAKQLLREYACLILDHQWKPYTIRRWVLCRDGINRERYRTYFRCARCSLEESTYTQYDVPRTLADQWEGARHAIYQKWLNLKNYRRKNESKNDNDLPF